MLTVEVDEVDEAPQPYQGLLASVVHAVSVADLSVGYSPRQMKVDPDHVAALAEVVDRLPPVVVDGRTMTVIDGVHRLEAYRTLGRSRIPALMFRGNDMEALVIAIQANIQHGKPLSRGERQEAARALLHQCPERSDRWLGEVCGVSHTTVAVLRRSLSGGRGEGKDGSGRPEAPGGPLAGPGGRGPGHGRKPDGKHPASRGSCRGGTVHGPASGGGARPVAKPALAAGRPNCTNDGAASG